MAPNPLPIILVSAQDIKIAESLISDLINEDLVERSDHSSMPNYRVWRLLNKYYRADVRLHPLGDGELLPLDLLTLIEAHIIYIIDSEMDPVTSAEKRICKETKADVCLLLFEGTEIPKELILWASDHHYEPVALRETRDNSSDSDSEDSSINEPFKDSYGIERAKAALHAHVWPGLVRIDLPAQLSSNFDGVCLSSDEEWQDWVSGDAGEHKGDDTSAGEGEGESQVERAEAFASALALLRGVRAQAEAGAGEGAGAAGDEARRARAERALAAFCRALGPLQPP